MLKRYFGRHGANVNEEVNKGCSSDFKAQLEGILKDQAEKKAIYVSTHGNSRGIMVSNDKFMSFTEFADHLLKGVPEHGVQRVYLTINCCHSGKILDNMWEYLESTNPNGSLVLTMRTSTTLDQTLWATPYTLRFAHNDVPNNGSLSLLLPSGAINQGGKVQQDRAVRFEFKNGEWKTPQHATHDHWFMRGFRMGALIAESTFCPAFSFIRNPAPVLSLFRNPRGGPNQ